MGRRRAGQRDGKKVGVAEGWEEGGRQGDGSRRVGHEDGRKKGGGGEMRRMSLG